MAKSAYPRYTPKQFEKLTDWSDWPEDHKAIVQAALVDGIRQLQIARAYGVTPQVVRNLVQRAVPLVDIHRIALIERESAGTPMTMAIPPQAPTTLTQKLRSDILRLRRQGLTPNRIQGELRVPLALVREAVRKSEEGTGGLTAAQTKKVLALRKRGLSYLSIAAETGFSLTAIRSVIPKNMQGRQKRRSRITSKVKEQILSLRKKGATYQEITQKTGVPPLYLPEILPPALRGRGLKTRTSLPAKTRNRIVRLRKKGFSYREIANDTQVPVALVRETLPAELRGHQPRH